MISVFRKGLEIMLKLDNLQIGDKVYYSWKGGVSIDSNIMENSQLINQFQEWEKLGFIEVQEVFGKDEK